MLYKVIAILVLLWLAGLASFIMLGGLIHLLLIIAIFVFAVEFMTEESA
ncbi:MAG: lmo0937 family membrane protein [Porphyrobacter sp. IPPAS B-1204]|nr:MAG: lmo0937 family membrane protein [Porphyrobacter sp. IPPAS B-1204]